MSEETETTTMETERTSWTRAEVERQEARAGEIEDQIAELQAREEELTDAIAEAHASGEDPEALVAERREVVELRGDLEAALPVLRERIEERREAALRAEAERRLTAISRAHGSARASYADDVARIEKKAEELEEAVTRADERYGNLQTLETESLCLLDRFPDLDPPTLTKVLPPAKQEEATTALERTRGLKLSRPSPLPARLVEVDGRKARRLRERIKTTPGGEILEAAGGEWTVEAHDERHRQAMEQNRDRKDAERLAEARAVDEWLRDLLANGPVPRDRIVAAARAEGIAVSGAGPASVAEARRRLDLRTLNPIVEAPSSQPGHRVRRSIDTSKDYWALPGGWDAEAFKEFGSERRLLV